MTSSERAWPRQSPPPITFLPRRAELDQDLLDGVLAAAHGSRRDRRRLRGALRQTENGEPADLALAEHLDAGLEPELRQVVRLRAGECVPRQLAAQLLGASTDEIARIELAACEQAAALTLAYHEDMICEPAALASADSPETRREAVRGHLAACRMCRAEFAARVVVVLQHTAALTSGEPAQAAQRPTRAPGPAAPGREQPDYRCRKDAATA